MLSVGAMRLDVQGLAPLYVVSWGWHYSVRSASAGLSRAVARPGQNATALAMRITAGTMTSTGSNAASRFAAETDGPSKLGYRAEGGPRREVRAEPVQQERQARELTATDRDPQSVIRRVNLPRRLRVHCI